MTALRTGGPSTPIAFPAQKVFALLDEISRHRALADTETDILEAIIKGDGQIEDQDLPRDRAPEPRGNANG